MPRRSDGFAGLKLVVPVDDDPEEDAYTVTIAVVDGEIFLSWTPTHADVDQLEQIFGDLRDVFPVAETIVRTRGVDSVPEFVQRAFTEKVAYRRRREAEAEDHDQANPWLCRCGRRFRTERGLNQHKSGHPAASR